MTKVAHIITKLELGGAQQNTLYTVSHLNKDCYEPLLISGRGGLLDPEAGKMTRVKVFWVDTLIRQINPWKDLLAFLKIYKILKKEKVVVVHTHSSKAGIIGRWAAYLAGVPVIIHTFHGFGFNDHQSFMVNRLFVWAERLTAGITHKLIAVSAENIRKGLANKIGTQDKYMVIHSGIKVNDFLTPPPEKIIINKKQELGINFAVPVVGMIACFKPQKSPEDFIKMAAAVKQAVPEVKFVLVGDGELRPGLEELIRQHNLQKEVILTGWRQDIKELFYTFDIFVLTSLWEGLPRVVLEAFLCQRPVVATDVDGTREVVKNAENGYLVKPHDVEEMSLKVISLLNDRERSKEMGYRGKALVDSSFDIDVMVKDIEKLYQSFPKGKECN
jgi:glycosyltransferase involved in cell wall biosynthesis